MAFGQLQIFRPDGPVETVILEGESVGIGRSPGNGIVLDRNGVSRYHVTFSVRDNQVYVEDLESANGTYVDGLPLKSNEPRQLRGGEEIQIADVRFVFQPLVDLDITVKTSTQTLELDEILLELEGPDMAVTPGTHVQAMLILHNRTSETARYKVSVEGTVSAWARLDRRELDVPANEKREVRIIFKPRRHSDSRPSEYDVLVRVVDANDESKVYELQSRLHVLKFSGYGVALATPKVEGDTPFQMYVHNQGNAPLSLDFRGESLGNALQFVINPSSVVLGAGERRTISGRISPKSRPFAGKAKEYRFDIISHAHDSSGFQAPISGLYMGEPLMAPWMILAGVGTLVLGILLVAILGVVLFTASDDDDPTATATQPPTVAASIVEFNINASETSVETPLLVTWNTEASELVSLLVLRDGETVFTFALPDADGQSYPITLTTAGRYTLQLQAGETLSAELVVFVKPHIELNISTGDDTPSGADSPAILYRHLDQEITISWNVDWTDNPDTTIQPPTVILDSEPLGYDEQRVSLNSAPQTISFMPTTLDPVRIDILSNGPDNIQASTNREIAVVDPTCDLPKETTNIYAGPAREGYPLLISLDPMTLRVDGRHENGEWLRVYIPPELNTAAPFGWVSVNDVVCEFTIADLLVSDDFPPVITPTPSNAPRPTPTITPRPTTEDATPPAQG